MKPARYIFVNKGLKMSPGKIGAQTAHAEMMATMDGVSRSALDATDGDKLFQHWLDTGYTKLVMEVRDSEHLYWVERYLQEHGYLTYLVIDEGRTEIDPHSPTAMAVELVDRDSEKVQAHFQDFRTYKDRKEQPKKKRLLG